MRADVLAKPAVEAVENGDIQFVPKQYENMYFSWMRDIQDWCISRQLWCCLLYTSEQVKALEARGYQGIYAFEPFAPELAQWSEADIEREIEQSIALIQRHCA